MTRPGRPRRRLSLPASLAGVLAGVGALALVLLALGSGHAPRAGAEEALPELHAQTDVAVPAEDVVMLGAEGSGPNATTWGLGELREGSESVPKLVRYTAEAGWQPGPELPAGFAPDHPESKPNPLEGEVTEAGYGVLAGTIAQEQVLLVRKPGREEAFTATAPVPSEAEEPLLGKGQLLKGQTLFGAKRAPMIAALHESDGSAGALVVPVYSQEGVDKDVLHWDGDSWSSEPIEVPKESEEGEGEFNVLAVAASDPQDAWLLARLKGGAIALFHRVKEEGAWSWRPVKVKKAVTEDGELALSVPVSGEVPAAGEPFGVVGAEGSQIAVESQLLTVSGEGVWVDGVRTDVERGQPYTTMYIRMEGEKGVIEQSWCKAPEGQPACQQSLPLEPPFRYGRSIAWASPSPYGERVITGLSEGVTLRLQGPNFEPVLSIGGGEVEVGAEPERVPGKLYGAAFSSQDAGWLGYSVPVQLTVSPEPDLLDYWPVATRHPLLAIAPEPGAPVAGLSSEALAVGESGGVARYEPGEGWLPESLFGPGERIEKPNLRAVAWPTTNRAYAVGDEGEMWLWRGETGLWERDPASPINLRANLYGIAFDPAEPARGYAVGAQAVGRGGVLLRYGKTWTEETGLPAEVEDAEFTGIAFAGSEAMVAYNVQNEVGSAGFRGGLLVNDGGGWTVDQEEQQVTAGARVDAVAGLPDGGAAVLAGEGTVRLYEREAAGAPWRLEATPLRTGLAGSLALYRQNGDGALRALLATGGAGTVAQVPPFEPSPGSPPYEQSVSTPATGPTAGALLRQTGSGWSDEQHDINPVEQGGHYEEYDEPSYPDAAVAALTSPSGSEGWVVGGITNHTENEQTADAARFPSSSRPPNEGTSKVPIAPEAAGPSGSGGVTTLAFGGGASCVAPCMDRVETGIGPEVWLEKAVSVMQSAGAEAFFYTGPMAHYSEYEGQQPPLPPYAQEYERYASVFGKGIASLPTLPTYAVVSEGELDGESQLMPAFTGLAQPLGDSPASGWAPPPGGSPAEHECAGCAGGYYAVANEHVVAVVLDDAAGAGTDPTQRAWLEQQLQQAGEAKKPVVVVAEADLSNPLAPGKHEEQVEALFAGLVGRDPGGQDPGHYAASAYFYDAPEEDVSKTISFDGASLRALGSGTLGYEREANEDTTEFRGAKGAMLGEVSWGHASLAEQAVDKAPVEARLVPVVGELAMEPVDGTLLRRSQPAVFRGLARRPRAGCRGQSNEDLCEESQYIPIPSICIGTRCSDAVLPEYEFRSSRPDIGGFVKLNTAVGNPLTSASGNVPSDTVLVNASGEPVKDGHEENGEQVGATSGLFCPYNKGETNVTISAGGLSYTLLVRVQAGSVREPCGTVPLRELPAVQTQATAAPPSPAPQPTPAAVAPAAAPPPVPPPPPPPTPAVPQKPVVPAPSPFVPLVAPVTPLLAFVPPPVPTPERPTPPTGTSAVTSPVEVAEKEEEQEEAPESVSNKAVAYERAEHEPTPLYVLGIVVLGALAGASARRRPRARRGEVRVAPATLNTVRAQGRWARDRRRERW